MYGENPFLIVNNKLFLLFCQSLILNFENQGLTFLMQCGNFVRITTSSALLLMLFIF